MVCADQGLTGTKLGCGEGGCGACTVMLSKKPQPGADVQHYAVNACLCPVYAAIGCHVITVEGIGNPRDGLHPVQVSALGYKYVVISSRTVLACVPACRYWPVHAHLCDHNFGPCVAMCRSSSQTRTARSAASARQASS